MQTFVCVVGLESLPAAELELVVLCKHQQAAISLQKQHAPMAARIVLSALKLLKNSQLFKPRKEAPITKRWVGCTLNRRNIVLF